MPAESERAAARVHWIVAGRFGAVSAGDTFEVSAGSLDAELARRAPSVEVEVPDRIGDGASRRVALRIGGLRTFTLAGVADAVPELKGLLALAARPPADAALAAAEVARLAGAGRLSRACAEAAAPAAAPPARGPDPRAAAAVDAFVGAVKGATPPGAPAGAARRLRDAIEAAVYGTALDVLRAEPVARLEGTWRGLRLLAERCPKGADMHVEAIDVEPGRLPALLAARPASDAFEEPDAVLVVDPVADLETLGALAEAAEAMLAPCVAEVAPALACAGGAAGAEDLAARLDRGGAAPPGWDALRAGDASRWLCAAVNRVALFSEGAGAFGRTAFGSPVWALGAMLAQSYRSQGAFAAVVGPSHALAAPAGWSIPAGPSLGVRAPTEGFLSVPAQACLAAAGLLGLGSPRNADRVVLAAAPTLASAPGALPLPAQILAGRIVRFARWARQQLDPAADAAAVQAIFEQAAGLFLFPGMGEAAALTARVEGEGPARALRVAARVKATHAGAPLAIEFALPL